MKTILFHEQSGAKDEGWKRNSSTDFFVFFFLIPVKLFFAFWETYPLTYLRSGHSYTTVSPHVIRVVKIF